MKPEDGHFNGLADFMKVRTDKSRMIGVNSKEKKKAIYWEDLNLINYDDLWTFIESIDRNEAELYPLDQYVD